MKEKVVYLLGAGFSAPLGLPLTSNFLQMSKDLFFGDPTCYSHFAPVLDTIAKMSVVKNYYRTDLHNIEEILSILEMQQSLGGRKLRRSFLQYISDVITAYTPVIRSQPTGQPANWHQGIFSSAGMPGRNYGYFVASLLRAQIKAGPRIVPLEAVHHDLKTPHYSVVSLNYDQVLERFAGYLSASFGTAAVPSFSETPGSSPQFVSLAKLHGSAGSEIIVPPTWNKSVTRKLLPSWKMAFDELSSANQIRILGYSLPLADSYVKYLLRAAAIEAPHLKRIDVLCLDDREGAAHRRYRDFIDFHYFRFANASIQDYVAAVYKASVDGVGIGASDLYFSKLENAHEDFFRAHSI